MASIYVCFAANLADKSKDLALRFGGLPGTRIDKRESFRIVSGSATTWPVAGSGQCNKVNRPVGRRVRAEHRRCGDWASLVHWVCGVPNASRRRVAGHWRRPCLPFGRRWPKRPPIQSRPHSPSEVPMNAYLIGYEGRRSHRVGRRAAHCASLDRTVPDVTDDTVVVRLSCSDGSKDQLQLQRRPRWLHVRREHGESPTAVVASCMAEESRVAGNLPKWVCAWGEASSWKFQTRYRCWRSGPGLHRGHRPTLGAPAQQMSVNRKLETNKQKAKQF